MAKDGERYGLGAACVAQLVLHAVAQAVHGELLVGDDSAQALHQHGRAAVSATLLGVAGKQRCLWVLRVVLDELAERYHSLC